MRGGWPSTTSGLVARDSEERRDETDLLCSRELGGTSCTWRLSGWFVFEGGGRTTMNACKRRHEIFKSARVIVKKQGGERGSVVGGASVQTMAENKETDLVGSRLLFLDPLLVCGHGSIFGKGGRVVIRVECAVGGLVRFVLCCGVVGDGREDSRWEYVLKGGEHLGTTNLARR